MISSDTGPDFPGQWEEIPIVVEDLPVEEDLPEDENDGTRVSSKGMEKEAVDGNNEETSSKAGSESNAEETQGIGNKYSTLSMVVRTKEAKDSELLELMSLRSGASATHALMEAVNLAMANKDWVCSECVPCSLMKLTSCVHC